MTQKPLLQQLKQVGLTYVTRPRMRWWAAFLFFLLCVGILSTWGEGRNVDSQTPSYDFFFLCLLGSVVPFVFLQDHTNWQFNHSRARLVPNFNRAHLTFTALILFLSLIALPTLFGMTTGGSILALTAGTALAISALAHKIPILFALLFFLIFFRENPWLAWLLNAPDGSTRPVLLFLLFASWAAIGRWLSCLVNRHEELPDYDQHNYAESNTSKSRTFRRAADRKQSEDYTRGRLKAWQLDRQIEHLLARANTLPKWRLLRSGNHPSKISPWGLLRILGFVLVYILFIVYKQHGAVSGFQIAEFLYSKPYVLWLWTLFESALYGMQLAERLPFMACESLFPFSKKEYFNGLMRGLANDALQHWALFHLAIGLLLHLPLSPQHPPPSTGTSLAYLWISLACMAFTFSLVALISCTIRGLAGAVVFVVISASVSGSLFFIWLEMRATAGDIPFLVAATGLLAVSWYLAICARMNWANIDLGNSIVE